MFDRLHVPQHRTDWTLAPAGCKWASCKVGDVTPSGWHGWIGHNVLLLKDTRKGAFSNRLLDDGCCFLYELPTPKSAVHDATMRRLHAEADTLQKKMEVRLFSVECANNFYLGEFVVVRIEWIEDDVHHPRKSGGGRMYARLRRLAVQDERVRDSYKVTSRPKRSRSESKHAAAVAELLPGWRILHEPECVSFYDSELVVDGKMREWGGDQYVCDYVAALGSRRVCIESKSSVNGLDEAAKLKARALRDHSLTRVVALLDHGNHLRWYDFGCPAAGEGVPGNDSAATEGEEGEVMGSHLAELRERLVR